MVARAMVCVVRLMANVAIVAATSKIKVRLAGGSAVWQGLRMFKTTQVLHKSTSH